MSEYGAEQVGAYGVGDALTGTGGCIALALYTATSIRVGTTLGEDNPERSQTAAFAGITYAALCGIIMAALLYFLRNDLAYLFSPLDENVRYLLCSNIVPVVGFYFLSAVQYGLWAVLEGQMRIAETGLCIGAGTWCVGIPLMHFFMPVIQQDHNGEMVFPERGDCFPTAIEWQVGYAETPDDGIALCEFNPTGGNVQGGKCPPQAFLDCMKDPTPFVNCDYTCPASSGCQFTPAYMVPPKDKQHCNDYMKNATWGSTLCSDDDYCSYSEPFSPLYIMWLCQCAGLLAGNTLMLICIITANWQKLAQIAVEYAEAEETEMASRRDARGAEDTCTSNDAEANRHGGILASAPPTEVEDDVEGDRDDP